MNKQIFKDNTLTIEEVRALFFDSDAIVEQPERVYRFDSPSETFYYTWDKTNLRPEYFMPVTRFIDASLPTPREIIEWQMNLGREEAKRELVRRSKYGTLMNIELVKMIVGGCDLEGVYERVSAYVDENELYRYGVEPRYWTEDIQKDILAFLQFCNDYEVKPLAMGNMLVSRGLGIGGEVDFVCEMNAQLYSEKTVGEKRRRVRALIDFKSGRSGSFYESNVLQLGAYQMIWDENFEEYPIDTIANWSPKDWRSKPSYNFKNHDGDDRLGKLEHIIEIARIDKLTQVNENKAIRIYTGKVDTKSHVTDHFQYKTVAEILIEKMLKR